MKKEIDWGPLPEIPIPPWRIRIGNIIYVIEQKPKHINMRS